MRERQKVAFESPPRPLQKKTNPMTGSSVQQTSPTSSNLGGMHRGKGVKAVDLCVGKGKNTTVGYSLQIMITGFPEFDRLFELLILSDTSVEPFVVPISRVPIPKVEVIFKVLQGNGNVLCCGAAFLGIGDHISLRSQRENLVRTVALIKPESGAIIGTITLTYLAATPFAYPTIPSIIPLIQRHAGVQLVGHRGTFSCSVGPFQSNPLTRTGLGQNFASHDHLQIGENTIQVKPGK